MKKIFTLVIFSFLFQNVIFTQNEFGAVGSFWQYSFEPHSGDGSGWTMIKIVKDTLIGGEPNKQYLRTLYFKPYTAPAIEQTSIGYIQIKNDSIYADGKLILDFNMQQSDSLFLENTGGVVDLQLAIDSIKTEQVAGIEYKQWFGQKICIDGANGTGPYETFTILESVGQVAGDYLFWNTDNCSIEEDLTVSHVIKMAILLIHLH